MVKYYFDKFTAIGTTVWVEGPWSAGVATEVSYYSFTKNYKFDPLTNKYSFDVPHWEGGTRVNIGDIAYQVYQGELIKYVATSSNDAGYRVAANKFTKSPQSSTQQTTYSIGSLVQSNVVAEDGIFPLNGRHTDGYWYIRKGVANTAPTFKQIPTQSTKKDALIALNLANYFTDAENDALSYTAASSNANFATATVSGNTLTLTGKAIGAVTVTVTASDGQLTTSQSFTLNVTNTAPTVSVSAPSANVTLYENDLLNLAGSASDVDTNQSVTVYAQVNNEQRIALAVGLSNAPVPFTKQLKFVGGKLYEGDTAITGILTDGIPHTLKVWAQDGDGGKSDNTERTFYVVPNRPPTLTVDTVLPGGIINTDKFSITGTASDPDGNAVTAAYKINGSNSIALEIIEGKWAFDIALGQLEVGQNTIVVELTDSYNFKVSKTIKLNKDEVKTPILQSVARYKIEQPKGSAKGVLLFIERDEALDVKVELSMTLTGEQEQYVTLTPVNTAIVTTKDGVVEDTFEYEGLEAKQNIILKITPSRTDLSFNHKIHLISGAVD